METLWSIIIIVAVIYFCTGSEYIGDCLSGLVIMAVGIGVTIAAFGINPLLGVIVGYFILQGWKRM